MNKDLVPKENIQIYCYLYGIETALRELIIDSLRAADGPLWYKHRLPGGDENSPLEKYGRAIDVERNARWTQSVPHHPIYYVDFPHLKMIIERKDNWEDIFEQIFSRKDILSTTLSELEFIRNKIAHNRKATCKDLGIMKGAYTKLSEAIGKRRFDELVARCTCAMDISERLTELQKEFERSFCICKNYEPLEDLEGWKSICGEWWFDESYLGHNISRIVNYFQAMEEYARLPRTRGSGHKIEAWVKSKDIETKYVNAQEEFSAITGLMREVEDDGSK